MYLFGLESRERARNRRIGRRADCGRLDAVEQATRYPSAALKPISVVAQMFVDPLDALALHPVGHRGGVHGGGEEANQYRLRAGKQAQQFEQPPLGPRSEESRGGTAWVCTCGSGWSQYP